MSSNGWENWNEFRTFKEKVFLAPQRSPWAKGTEINFQKGKRIGYEYEQKEEDKGN
jgi:hypothetical protein